MIDKSNIAVITTVINFELYQKTAKLFPEGVKKYVIDGRNGMHGIDSIRYMIQVLKNKGIEWLIMADEDVIFTESSVVFSLIEEMKKNKFTITGVRDGGIISHRKYNPFVINTFFSIINFMEIEQIWSVQDMMKNQFSVDNEFDDDLSKFTKKYDKFSLYEPYYCFYLWLRRYQKKILFLEANMCDDKITNNVLFNGTPFLYHTWFARSYGRNKKHTNRIDFILNKYMGEAKFNKVDYLIYKDSLYYINSVFIKMLKKIKMKLNI